MEAAVRLYTVIVRPLFPPGLLLWRCERRDTVPVLRVLHHESVGGFGQRHHVITLSEKMQIVAMEALQHLGSGRHVVGVQEGRASDRYQLRIEEALSDPTSAPVAFVPVVGP